MAIFARLHQEIKRDAIIKLGFNPEHGFAADFGQIFQILTNGGRALKVPLCPVKVEAGGISDMNRIRATNLHAQIVLKKYTNLTTVLYWCGQFIDQSSRIAAKIILPNALIDRIRRLLHAVPSNTTPMRKKFLR